MTTLCQRDLLEYGCNFELLLASYLSLIIHDHRHRFRRHAMHPFTREMRHHSFTHTTWINKELPFSVHPMQFRDLAPKYDQGS